MEELGRLWDSILKFKGLSATQMAKFRRNFMHGDRGGLCGAASARKSKNATLGTKKK